MESRRYGNAIFGAVSALIGGVLLLSSFRQAEEAFVLPGSIPPFLVPKVFLTAWVSLSLLIMISGLRTATDKIGLDDWRPALALAAVLVVSAVLMRPLGFMAVVPVAVFLTSRILGFRRNLLNLAISILASGSLYLALTQIAELPLPQIPSLL